MREFERSVMQLKDWKNLCYAEPEKEGEVDKVACHKTKSFQSPLSIIPDVDKLEVMTDE